MTPEILRAVADALEAGEPLRVELRVLPADGAAPRARVALTAAERAANYRASRRVTPFVTKSDEPSRTVTNGVTEKEVPPQTPPPESSPLSDQKEAEMKPESGSGVRIPPAASAHASVRAASRHVTNGRDVTDHDDESPLPPRFVETAIERGVLSDMLDGMPGVTLEQLEDAANEFASYWGIGAGMGKKRRHWMARLRESLRRQWREGRLRAPGAIEHGETTGRGRNLEEPARARRLEDPWAWQWAQGGPKFGQPRPVTGPEADPNRKVRANGHR